MGREIRRVPADWEHPRYTKENAPYDNRIGEHIPMYDDDYDSACEKWYAEAASFTPKDYAKYYHEYAGSPPDEESYRARKWTEEEATHWVVYQTVSEGTPVTPAFATKEELIEYLVKNGDFWDQKRGDGGWNRDSATRFVNNGWAPSFILTTNGLASAGQQ